MLRSTFAGFTTAQLAMSASQRSLDVTGQNIANINTKGYTRQRLDLASISPTGHSYFQMQTDCRPGQGVQMTGIIQIRDPFLDIQYRNHLAKVGTIDAHDSMLSEIGEIFDEVDSEAIRAALNDVVKQLNNMSNPDNVGESSSDALVRSSMEVLLNLIHENGKSLDRVQEDLITKLQSTDIENINGYFKSIAQLNESIKNSQILGSPALELLDQRNALIDELATYLPISVTYEDLELGAGIKVDTLKISFKASDGKSYVLVDDTEFGEINMTTPGAADTTNVAEIGLKAVGDTQFTDITDFLGDGVLKGSMDALNADGIFDATNDFRGIGYYDKFFDTFVDTFAKALNDANKAVQIGPDGKPVANPDYDENDPSKGGPYLMEDRPLFQTLDGTDNFSADNIKIADGWKNGDYGITISTEVINDEVPSDANENILRMIKLITTDTISFQGQKEDGTGPIEAFKGSFLDAYDNIQNTQAVDKKASASVLDNRLSVLNQIANSKDAVSGVYMDEEVMNLMRYQQSYNAAARLMTTLDQALDTLINNTGVVGR